MFPLWDSEFQSIWITASVTSLLWGESSLETAVRGVYLQFSSVHFSRSVMSDSATPWIAARQASLFSTISQSSLSAYLNFSILICRSFLSRKWKYLGALLLPGNLLVTDVSKFLMLQGTVLLSSRAPGETNQGMFSCTYLLTYLSTERNRT